MLALCTLSSGCELCCCTTVNMLMKILMLSNQTQWKIPGQIGELILHSGYLLHGIYIG